MHCLRYSGRDFHCSFADTLLNRCQADESFLTDILTKKFNNHLTLYRICEILGQNRIGISLQILSQWVIRCGQALMPLYEEMNKSHNGMQLEFFGLDLFFGGISHSTSFSNVTSKKSFPL